MLPKRSLAAAALFGCGFAFAWLVKSTPTITRTETAPPRARQEHNEHPQPTSNSAAATFDRLQAAGYDMETRAAVIASLSPEEIPALLALLKERAGIYNLNYQERDQFEELVKHWYAKAPQQALAWLHGLPNRDNQELVLGVIVDGLIATDLTAALALLKQESSDESGRVTIPENLLEKAPAHGAEVLTEICKLGHNDGGCTSGIGLTYPDDFDFKRVLTGLAEAKAASGEDSGFSRLPCDLISQWTRRDPQAAWAWLQEGKTITFNGTKEFFEAYASSEAVSPKDVGVLLASTFEPAADPEICYENVWAAIGMRPSPEILDSFIQTAPGERATLLDGLFDQAWSYLGGPLQKTHPDAAQMHVHALLLERMTHSERLEAMRRNNPYLLSRESERDYAPILRRLRHSEAEIQALWPGLHQ